ncbi:MAG: tRNA (guanosine(46)-N7)-methyltransferase TrmB [Spirochaetales bacterium]|nr:tRNA (guanosine(46)-N7)-methyltransferase TrmB [Spirochaetales bacterium]
MSEERLEEELTEEEKGIFDLFPQLARVERRQENGHREIKSFVLRGQKLKDFQIKALKEHFYEYAIVYNHNKPMDFEAIFGNKNPVIIEIGFGMGESTLKIAKENPDRNYIGIEVFLYGFSKLLANASKENLSNLRLMRFDAVQVLQDMVPDNSVDGFHVFFPDPWPKKRHHKKRLIQVPFAELLASKLKSGGYIYCVTDWEDYANQMLEVFGKVDILSNPYNGFAPQVPWRPETGFERKGLEKDYKINEIWVEKR